MGAIRVVYGLGWVEIFQFLLGWVQQLSIRYDTRCYFNVRSKADISQLNLPHGTLGPSCWLAELLLTTF